MDLSLKPWNTRTRNPLYLSPEDLDGGVTTDLEPVAGLLTRLRTVNLDKDNILLISNQELNSGNA